MASLAGSPSWAHPGALITVNDLGDNTIAGDGKCTLREAVINAAYQDDLTLGDCAPGLDNETIDFSVNGTITVIEPLYLDGDMTIDGTGHSITLDGDDAHTIVATDGSHHIFKHLTFINGNATKLYTSGKVGGGAIAKGGGILTVMNCHFENNHSDDYGGAMATDDEVNVINSSFTANSADKSGGAIYAGFAYVTIAGSTFTDNSVTSSADFGGGGIAVRKNNRGGGLDVTGSTFDGNFAVRGAAIRVDTIQNFVTNSTFTNNWGSSGSVGAALHAKSATYVTNSTFYMNNSLAGGSLHNDGGDLTIRNSIMSLTSCSSGNVTDGGFNIAYSLSNNCPGVNTDPMLAGLADNGGPTRTMALQSGSPAIHAAEPAICRNVVVLNTDQRGRMRISGSDTTCDIGAYEWLPSASATATPTPTNTPFADGWIYCVEENQTCRFDGVALVRYGANGTYTELTRTSPVSCDNATFGDPLYGVAKHCDIKISATPTPTPPGTPIPDLEGWERCASEGGACYWSGTKYIRYGVPGSYTLRMMTTFSPCNNSMFGDPAPGVSKHCDLHAVHTPIPTSTASPTPTATP